MTSKLRKAVHLALLLAAVPPAVSAQGTARSDKTLEEVTVFGRAERKIGVADAASEGTVGGDDLLVRPLLRVAELLESVPGLIAAQHSGSGKANQYFLRGFQLDHGTDFTTYVDDMPWNLRSHGHGQGYLDVNGLIPEIIERIDYRKGPYRADAGDFSMAGSGYLTTIDRLAQPFTAVEFGSNGWGRLAAGGSAALAGGELTLLADYKTYDSPFDLDEDLKHKSLWTKYVTTTSFGEWQISLAGYLATWRPTEQTPESAFGTAGCRDEFCSLDRTAYGETDRWIVTSNWTGDNWRATAYAQFYDWHMLSNPTYEADGQIDQFDERITVGGRYERSLVASEPFELRVGAETQYDAVEKVGLDSTVDGEFVENIGDSEVNEGSIALYAEASWRPIEDLRLMAGMRGDYFDFDVSANAGSQDAENVGQKSDKTYSPKLGVAYAVNENFEVYGNWGQGFHSNSARGVVKREDPVPGLVLGTGYEAGVRWEVENFNVSLTHWWLNLSSELIFVGDDNTVEPKGGSERRGWEVVAFWRPFEWLGVDAVYTRSRARYEDPQDDGGFYVEGGVESAGELGVSATPGSWEFSARLRYLGPYALLPDNSERSERETAVNVRAAYNWERLSIYGEVLNALDHDGKDIVYYYENFYDPNGGRVSRAEEPRSVRVGLKYKF